MNPIPPVDTFKNLKAPASDFLCWLTKTAPLPATETNLGF